MPTPGELVPLYLAACEEDVLHVRLDEQMPLAVIAHARRGQPEILDMLTSLALLSALAPVEWLPTLPYIPVQSVLLPS